MSDDQLQSTYIYSTRRLVVKLRINAYRQTDRQTDRRTDRHTQRQTDRQMDEQTHTETEG